MKFTIILTITLIFIGVNFSQLDLQAQTDNNAEFDKLLSESVRLMSGIPACLDCTVCDQDAPSRESPPLDPRQYPRIRFGTYSNCPRSDSPHYVPGYDKCRYIIPLYNRSTGQITQEMGVYRISDEGQFDISIVKEKLDSLKEINNKIGIILSNTQYDINNNIDEVLVISSIAPINDSLFNSKTNDINNSEIKLGYYEDLRKFINDFNILILNNIKKD